MDFIDKFTIKMFKLQNRSIFTHNLDESSARNTFSVLPTKNMSLMRLIATLINPENDDIQLITLRFSFYHTCDRLSILMTFYSIGITPFTILDF